MNEEVPVTKILIGMFMDLKTKDDYELMMQSIATEDLYLPMNGNEVVFLPESENHNSLPLFPSTNKKKELKHTSYDVVKVEKIIREIFGLGKFDSIVINPYNDDIIIGEKSVELLKKYIVKNMQNEKF